MMFWRGGLLAILCVPAVLSAVNNDATDSLQGRRMEDQYFEYDLSQFSIRFDKCQHVKMYDDDLAEDNDYDDPLAVKHLVVYRLCPSDSCGTCSTIFGSYVAELEDFLELTIAAQEAAFEQMCANCQERCNEDGGYCSGCGKLCYRYENLENDGYVDAAQFIQCQELDMGDDKADDDSQLYIGPRCSRDGSRVLIGLFSDENCLEPYADEDPEDYIGSKISYHLLSHSNANQKDNICLSCEEYNENGDQDNNNNNGDDDEDHVSEMCEEVYALSGKCESKNGLTSGFIQMNKDDNDYENQVENEFLVCNFIDSLLWNSYTESGEINVDDPQDVIYRAITPLQKWVLSSLVVTLVALLGGMYYLQKLIAVASEEKINLAWHAEGQMS